MRAFPLSESFHRGSRSPGKLHDILFLHCNSEACCSWIPLHIEGFFPLTNCFAASLWKIICSLYFPRSKQTFSFHSFRFHSSISFEDGEMQPNSAGLHLRASSDSWWKMEDEKFSPRKSFEVNEAANSSRCAHGKMFFWITLNFRNFPYFPFKLSQWSPRRNERSVIGTTWLNSRNGNLMHFDGFPTHVCRWAKSCSSLSAFNSMFVWIIHARNISFK